MQCRTICTWPRHDIYICVVYYSAARLRIVHCWCWCGDGVVFVRRHRRLAREDAPADKPPVWLRVYEALANEHTLAVGRLQQ